jgi:four helix bundle protein
MPDYAEACLQALASQELGGKISLGGAFGLCCGIGMVCLPCRIEERYALVDQMRRSSRGVCGNIVEGFAKRGYENVFKNSLNNSLGESEETKLWLDFALDCDYIQADEHKRLTAGYGQVSAMLWTLMTKWETY